jgi:hypothetical protein
VVHAHRAAHDRLVALVHVDLDPAVLEAQRVAEGDQLVRALGAHGAGDDRGLEHRALAGLEARLAQRLGDLAREAHPRLGDRDAVRDLLAAHVHHRRLAALVDVVEVAAHGRHPPM